MSSTELTTTLRWKDNLVACASIVKDNLLMDHSLPRYVAAKLKVVFLLGRRKLRVSDRLKPLEKKPALAENLSHRFQGSEIGEFGDI